MEQINIQVYCQALYSTIGNNVQTKKIPLTVDALRSSSVLLMGEGFPFEACDRHIKAA